MFSVLGGCGDVAGEAGCGPLRGIYGIKQALHSTARSFTGSF